MTTNLPDDPWPPRTARSFTSSDPWEIPYHVLGTNDGDAIKITLADGATIEGIYREATGPA